MKFQKPIFHSGINLTVRKGVKWNNRLSRNSTIKLEDAGGDCHHIARVKQLLVHPWEDIEERQLEEEHNPDCRTKKGLEDRLMEIYGDFGSKDYFTLVYFEPISDCDD